MEIDRRDAVEMAEEAGVVANLDEHVTEDGTIPVNDLIAELDRVEMEIPTMTPSGFKLGFLVATVGIKHDLVDRDLDGWDEPDYPG